MKHSRLLMAVALASSFGLPIAVQAQVTNGSASYGIFGGGTPQGGGGFGVSSSGQQGLGTGAVGSFGRSSTSALTPPTLSPYLNLARTGNAAVNYYALVRPQVQQNAFNTQVGTSIQQTDRLLYSQHQTARPAYDPYGANELAPNALPSNSRTPEPAAPAAQRRRASDDADAGPKDWASGAKDSGFTGDVGTGEDARQRAASLRRAKELKALEDELSGNADSSTTPPARTAGAQPTYPPGLAAMLRPANHYFPQATGMQANHTNSPPRSNSGPR
jgi:hypothetical protein